jgi:hypothetical protein
MKKTSEYQRKWREANRDKYNQYQREYVRTLRQENIGARLFRNLQARLSTLQHGLCLRDLLGCDEATLVEHLEGQFTSGMSWENYGRGYGKWEIDHIRPFKDFDLTDPEQAADVCHYTNIQPKWSVSNRKKDSKAGRPKGAKDKKPRKRKVK